MPQIELVPVNFYEPGDAYNSIVDNKPLRGIVDRIALLNFQTDINSNILRESIGTAGTLDARLGKSLNLDGSLKPDAIDDALHNIAHHTDGTIVISDTVFSYVRMTAEERAKLELVAPEATNLCIRFDLDNIVPSNIPSVLSTMSVAEALFCEHEVHFKRSDSIGWRIDETGGIIAETTFPQVARHRHHYDLTPIHQDPITPNYMDYKVTSVGTPYQEGSLRVYVNGIRLSQTDPIYIPQNFVMGGPSWLLVSFVEGAAVDGVVPDGTFSLSTPILSSDIIKVDFETLFN
jgi:hypothetical protein